MTVSQPLPPADGRPLADRVEAALRRMIADGAAAPDEVLVQQQLAAQLGVSRTPLREALHRLAEDGIVERQPGGGFRVREVTAAQVSDVHQVRGHLELLAVMQSVGRHGRVDLAVLEDLIDEHAAADPTDANVQFDMNRRFHRAVIAPCSNAYLLETIDRLWDHPVHRQITRAYIEEAPGNAARMVTEHRELLAALVAGDTDEAMRLSSDHIDAGYGPLAR